MMTLYSAKTIGSELNLEYAQAHEIRDEESFRQAVRRDYVAATYRGYRRKRENFLWSDTLAMDCDNDHSDQEKDWMTPEKIMDYFQGVAMAFHFSRNHMKQKGNEGPRPRFHCFFAIRRTESAEEYAELKQKVNAKLPIFDKNAADAARFFYGTKDPQVILVPGEKTMDQWLEEHAFDGKYKFKPGDPFDLAEAELLEQVAGGEMKYLAELGYLVYNGIIWEHNDEQVRAKMHELSDLQLQEAKAAIRFYSEEGEKNGTNTLAMMPGKRGITQMNDEQRETYRNQEEAGDYHKLAMRYRQSRNIDGVMKEVRAKVQVLPGQLDHDPYLLNTPEGVYDLRRGMAGKREHRAEDYMTRVTSISPGNEGAKMWEETLDTFFQGDPELKEYVHRVAGLIAVGEVQREELIIAYGEGRNGKSTFWNVIAKVLGNYSGLLSADVLTNACRRNVKPEMAELRGKRMVIAGELEEGLRLNTAMVKQLCSTDKIKAEPKYKQPFDFDPSHTLVLYTNHLPKVGAKDEGIWRRLIVIPFQAKIEGKGERKNYTKELLEKAGGAILKWIIEGAEMIIREEFQIKEPACVAAARGEYKSDNDWISHFLEERCMLERTLSEKSGELYRVYRQYCAETGEYTRSTTDFYRALEKEGFERKKTAQGVIVMGLQVKVFNEEEAEFKAC